MKIMMVAGELSGDTHGGSILAHLKRLIPGLEAFGVGGPLMIAEGLRPLLPFSEFQAAGLLEVIRHIPKHLGHLRLLERHLDSDRPDAALLIDYPGFNLNVAKAAKSRGIPVIFYSSPQLWASRGGRMKKIARWVDKIIVLFPFEVPLYLAANVDAEFLGHPLVGVTASAEEAATLRRRAAADDGRPVVAIMPGSRPQELRHILPNLLEAVRLIREAGYSASFVLPVASTLKLEEVKARVRESGADVLVAENAFLPLLQIADMAIVASGTATLQVGMAGIPFVVVYRLSSISYNIMRRFMYVKDVSIVNILAGRRIVPELLQRNFSPEHLRDVFLKIALDEPRKKEMRGDLAEVTDALGEPGAYARAAAVIAKMLHVPENPAPGGPAGTG